MSLREAIDKPVHLRPPAVVGRFYPSAPDVLLRDLTHYLDNARSPGSDKLESDKSPLRAIIAPHGILRVR